MTSAAQPKPILSRETKGSGWIAQSFRRPPSRRAYLSVAIASVASAILLWYVLVSIDVMPSEFFPKPTRVLVTAVEMFGGGGFNGSIPNVAGNVPAGPANQLTPLGRGYATFASDSGHQANALASQDNSFGLNDEALRNFGGDAIKKTHDAAVFLIKARYAAGSIQKAYFAGGSGEQPSG